MIDTCENTAEAPLTYTTLSPDDILQEGDEFAFKEITQEDGWVPVWELDYGHPVSYLIELLTESGFTLAVRRPVK